MTKFIVGSVYAFLLGFFATVLAAWLTLFLVCIVVFPFAALYFLWNLLF
jgi:hypothetical protein